MYLRRYYAEYHCTFNLRFFPFDEQVCKMEFKARTVTRYVFSRFDFQAGNLYYKARCVLVTVGLSGILKGKQKLGVTFNSDKLSGIDFTKFSKLTMCSA